MHTELFGVGNMIVSCSWMSDTDSFISYKGQHSNTHVNFILTLSLFTISVIILWIFEMND